MSYAMQGSLSRSGGYQPQGGDPKEQTLMWQQGHYMGGPDSGIQSGAQTQAPSLTGHEEEMDATAGNDQQVPTYLWEKPVKRLL